MELLQEKYEDINKAVQSVKKAIAVYNELRPHLSLDMLTPQKAHTMTGFIKRKWQNYYPEKKRQTIIV